MRNLVRPLLRLLGRNDGGAIGVLVAVLFGGGVLLGMGALTIDVGQIYQNRAELQNGADAGALAIATQCAHGACPANSLNTAVTYATDNASALTGDTAGVDCIHGSDGLSAGACPPGVAGGGGLKDCPPDPPAGTNFVDVQRETTLKNGSLLLPPIFAETIVSGSTYDGTTVRACAQAEWGASGGVAFTISACELDVATGGTTTAPGDVFWNQPGYPTNPADSAYDQALTFHQGNGNSGPPGPCPQGPAGQDEPGAFGWTSEGGVCITQVTNGTYQPDHGNSAHDCLSSLETAYASKSPVSIPIYSSINASGAYVLAGYVPFVITGFNVTSQSEPDWLNPGLLCGHSNGGPNDVTCIDGYFLANTLSQSPGPVPGASPVKLTG